MADKYLKIAYIGGGSRAWARKLMCDLAVADDICGEVRLYDIDKAAAKDNDVIVLAQGSMTVLLPHLGHIEKPVLSSPRLGIEYLKQVIGE